MLTAEQISRLLDVAGAACHSGAVFEARQIYAGLLVARPGSLPIYIGEAFSHIVVDEFEIAEDILKSRVLSKEPENAEALALLGMAYMLSGKRAEGRQALSGIEGLPSPAGQLARDLLAGFAT